MVNTPRRFHVNMQGRALKLQSGRVRTPADLLQKNIENTAPITIRFLRTLEMSQRLATIGRIFVQEKQYALSRNSEPLVF